MTSPQLRIAFLNFFKAHGHTVVPSSSLLPDDPSVLLTTAGMQQFKPYLTGTVDAAQKFGSKSVFSIQKCFRTTDIDDVGDFSHLTFFEMVGNFSFGGYFKERAIPLSFEFITSKDGLGLDPHRLYTTAFEGDSEVPRDNDAIALWQQQFKNVGMNAEIGERIFLYGRKKNWWEAGPGPAGPDAEMFYDLGGTHDPKFGSSCHPNCDCGRFIEIGNDVFVQYNKTIQGVYEPLAQKSIDNGRGFERLVMVVQGKKNIFDTDIFQPIIKVIASQIPIAYQDAVREYRIITDHIRSACFLIVDGVLPSNLGAGYVLRRIIRRMIRAMRTLGLPASGMQTLVDTVIQEYGVTYPELKAKAHDISAALAHETEKFTHALEKGLKEFERLAAHGVSISGTDAFMLYESYGFPFEMTQEIAKEQGSKVDEAAFQKEMEKHKEVSKVGMDKKDSAIAMRAEFQGVNTEEDVKKVTRYHTAAHLMHAALQKVLGPEVKQMGSNITPLRMRFDFTFPRKVNPEEITKVEDMVNEQIKNDLPVSVEETTFEAAVAHGAHAFFKEKYPPKVTVYSISTFSKEVCGGPHVARTGEVGIFKILKEEASSAGVRRIRALIE